MKITFNGEDPDKIVTTLLHGIKIDKNLFNLLVHYKTEIMSLRCEVSVLYQHINGMRLILSKYHKEFEPLDDEPMHYNE